MRQRRGVGGCWGNTGKCLVGWGVSLLVACLGGWLGNLDTDASRGSTGQPSKVRELLVLGGKVGSGAGLFLCEASMRARNQKTTLQAPFSAKCRCHYATHCSGPGPSSCRVGQRVNRRVNSPPPRPGPRMDPPIPGCPARAFVTWRTAAAVWIRHDCSRSWGECEVSRRWTDVDADVNRGRVDSWQVCCQLAASTSTAASTTCY